MAGAGVEYGFPFYARVYTPHLIPFRSAAVRMIQICHRPQTSIRRRQIADRHVIRAEQSEGGEELMEVATFALALRLLPLSAVPVLLLLLLLRSSTY